MIEGGFDVTISLIHIICKTLLNLLLLAVSFLFQFISMNKYQDLISADNNRETIYLSYLNLIKRLFKITCKY